MIWTGALMLEFLGHQTEADLIVRAIKALTAEGRVLPKDLGGSAGTTEVTDALIAKMRAMA